MLVTMNKTTNYEGLKLKGSEYEVKDEVAKRWINRGLASLILASSVIAATYEVAAQPVMEATEYLVEAPEPIVVDDVDLTDEDVRTLYADLSAKQLFTECKSLGIEVEPKMDKEYYIEELVKISKE